MNVFKLQLISSALSWWLSQSVFYVCLTQSFIISSKSPNEFLMKNRSLFILTLCILILISLLLPHSSTLLPIVTAKISIMSPTQHNIHHEVENSDSNESLNHHHPGKQKPAVFETVLGITDGGVQVYSCDYQSIDKSKYAGRESFQMFYQGVFTGYKYQCVELARRYMLINYGTIFESVTMAYDIFNLLYVKRVADNKLLSIDSYANGSPVRPVKGSLIIWAEGGEFARTGHVAVAVDATDNWVDIVEQNVEDTVWPAGQNYSRRLQAKIDSDTGAYNLQCTFSNTKILGWMTIALDKPSVTYEDEFKCTQDSMRQVIIQLPQCPSNVDWLDQSRPENKVWAEMHGERLVEAGGKSATYYAIAETALNGLKRATDELHRMFLHATEVVLHNEKLFVDNFRLPKELLPKLLRSYYNRHKNIVSGRFDFSLTADGLKVYEYNADSASCLLECGRIQECWAQGVGIGSVGRDPSPELFSRLVETWRADDIRGTLHMLHDDGSEERYHTLYMKSAAEAAGINCKIIQGTDGFQWTDDGLIKDSDGLVIKNVWKTWSWQTALNQLEERELHSYLQNMQEAERAGSKGDFLNSKPRLVDVLLHDKVRVIEPLWTLIPSCKAILPVLWSLYPDHPYLLPSSFELTDEIKKGGYVTKPITGRGGGNVVLYNQSGEVIEKTAGKWTEDKDVYQVLCALPKYGEDNVQVCCFAVNGTYGGTVLRVDKSKIIGMESSVYCLRVVPDNQLTII